MWYHLSSEFLGNNPTLIPRIPLSVADIEDTTQPRICFAPSIEHCLIGITGTICWSIPLKNANFYIYAIHKNSKVMRPSFEMVPDAEKSGEVWRIIPTTLKFQGKAIIKNHKLKIYK